MSTSSAASSTLTRSRITILALATIATVYAGYHFYSTYAYEAEISSLPGTGVHRSNAVHRRRRRNTTSNSDPSRLFEDEQQENEGDGPIPRTLTDGETVVDDQEYAWTEQPPTYQRSGQNIVQLLFRVSEDATRRNAYVHRGCLCNGCGTVPIRGIRYRCANCADYDLCENCESQGVHIKSHIFYKIKVPAPSFGPRHTQPVWYTGNPSAVDSQLSKHISAKLSRETGFERPELDAYWEQWTYMANTEWREDPDEIKLAMDRKTFERCLVPSGGYRLTAPSLIFDRMFAFYDTNKDDLISFPEFLHGIAYRKKKDKWIKIFQGYDIDGDEYVERKDFLRIFRSYYVLYRQMHQDMLEGMEDQQMNTTEAHRLISGRQPLSSAFGADGRFPRAPDLRAGEGKGTRPGKEEEILDGKGVMTESGNDTGDREDVFRRIPRIRRQHSDQDSSNRVSGYWETLLNPPENVDEMGIAFGNITSEEVADILQSVVSDGTPLPQHEIARVFTLDGMNRGYEPEDIGEWPPTSVAILDEDIEAVEGPGVSLEQVSVRNRRKVLMQARDREMAKRKIHERWQQRQFYTDEEEGALPPADWKEEDDVLAGPIAESSKAQATRHSRSSSKVRFAEDMDDYDTRSNPSTSSRSVPERWGGMEIPYAEKDAGKEVLFQVTQQAFNELLDALFKDKEEFAIEAAMTKAERDRYRGYWETHEFEKYALEREAREEEKREESPQPPSFASQPTRTQPLALQDVEVDQLRQRSIGELLAASGYEVEEDDDEEEHVDEDDVPPTPVAHSRSDDSSPPQSTPQESEPDSPTYRDPTLPQFRPSTLISQTPSQDPILVETPPSNTESAPSTKPLHNLPSAEPLPASPLPNDNVPLPTDKEHCYYPFKADDPSQPLPVDDVDNEAFKERCYYLWKIDKAIEEAEFKGGFGRLDFAEFYERVKRLGETENGRKQMDYLGSWIEFCIP